MLKLDPNAPVPKNKLTPTGDHARDKIIAAKLHVWSDYKTGERE